jgi:hypothetical protein
MCRLNNFYGTGTGSQGITQADTEGFYLPLAIFWTLLGLAFFTYENF